MLTSEKLDRINNAIDEHKAIVDELALKSARPQPGTSTFRSASTLQHKAAFEAYVRHGEANGLHKLEEKAPSVGSGPDGGYLVPEETEAAVIRGVKIISPIRAIAGNRVVSASVYKKPFAITGPSTGWVAETATRPETNSPTLAELTFPTMELYAMPSATQTLLDDSAVNIDEWLAEEVQVAFAQQEGTAFVSGDGSNKPKGFLGYTKVANGSWSWGNVGYVPTGTDAAFDVDDPSDDLIDFIYALKSEYRANAHWVMNRATQATIRKFKDADGNYIWQPAERADLSPTLMNYPIAEFGEHAEYRLGQLLDRLRRFPAWLSRRRPRRHPRASRSVFRQTVCAVLHHQARRRRSAGLRCHQALEVRHVITESLAGPAAAP